MEFYIIKGCKTIKCKVFKNINLGKIRTILVDNKVWFIGRDVTTILKYKNSSCAISRFCKNAQSFGIKTNGGVQQMKCISEDDLIILIQYSQTISTQEKEMFQNWLIDLGLISNTYNQFSIIRTRKELEFINKLESFLCAFNITDGIKQYSVFNYKIDYYIPSLNIAIEYDENNHKQYTYAQHELRQRNIENEIGCRFIRLSDENTDYFNLGIIAQNILIKDKIES